MLRTDLIETLNSGQAWLFVGSGVSVDAGLPSWKALTQSAIARIGESGREQAQALLDKGRYADAIQAVEDIVGRTALEEFVRREVSIQRAEPERLATKLADWPVAGYLTTNYDHVLERALTNRHLPGWLTVGNTSDEIRKVSGDVSQIIWHLHGSAELGSDASKLVLTSNDYDAIYLDASPLHSQLRGFLTQHRMIFIGFSFGDPEVLRLLRLVGRYTIPERPIYAFLGHDDSVMSRQLVEELRTKHNVHVIPYRIAGGRHDELVNLVDVYDSFLLRRSLNFGRKSERAPSYDPETTGLLVYNTLVLQGMAPTEDIASSLLAARILALLHHRGPVSVSDIQIEVNQAAQLLTQPRGKFADRESSIRTTLDELSKLGLVNQPAYDEPVHLETLGEDLVKNRWGSAQRLKDQFYKSLSDRTAEMEMNPGSQTDDIVGCAAAFLQEAIDRRSLGVALALAAEGTGSGDFQIVALLQSLPAHLETLADQDDAEHCIRLVLSVLEQPTELEAKYLGLVLQARLGLHLLGADPDGLRARSQEVARTTFILDSTTLIPLLAKGSTGHTGAVDLLRRATIVGARLATTDFIAEEAREHGQYAIRFVVENGSLTPQALGLMLGDGEERTNAFLEGFYYDLAGGGIASNSFSSYISKLFGTGLTNSTVSGALSNHLIETRSFNEWDGFDDALYAEAEELQEQITFRRRQGGSYKHDRQVKAEAEVVVLVKNLRSGSVTIDDKHDHAYFISNSRFLDSLADPKLPITMRQTSLHQWLGTLAPIDESELGFLIDSLLWELEERGFDIVDRATLRVAFSAVVSAAEDTYLEHAAHHRTLIATELGIDPSLAFHESMKDSLEYPLATLQHTAQALELETARANRAEAREGTARRTQEISERERTELQRRRSKSQSRTRRQRARKRQKPR